MANVLLIQPPLTKKELFVRGSRTTASVIPPLGLAYIASYLIKHGHHCTIVDGIAQEISIKEIVLLADRFDVIGITVVSTYAVRAIEMLKALKQKGIASPIVVGGPHITALPESLLSFGADIAVVGEGEITMLEVVECLAANKKNLHQIPGVVFRKEGEFVHTGPRDRMEDLDRIPLPARHLLPMELYKSSIARSTQALSHSMLASRGCPGVCTYCSKKTFGTKTRYFSVERIVEEFFLLRDQYGAKDVAVWDDNFVANPDIVLAVCEKLRKKNFDISWSIESRIDIMNQTVLKALKASGCTYIAYGIESGSQRMLDRVHKRTTKEKIREVIQLTRQAGIFTRGYFMLGLTEETPAEMDETIRFAIELDLDVASFTLFVPLPGTTEYYRSLKTGTFTDPEYYHHFIVPEFNFLEHPLYIPEGLTGQELLSIHRNAYNRYYFRPKILLRKLRAVKSKEDIAALVNSGQTLIRNLLFRT